MSVETGRRVLLEEAGALERLAGALDASFEQAVQWFLECEGRVITCGLGKSGHIARKTAGTLSSTGTPSLFLHAAEAVHGDLGMVTRRDIVLLYTHSGETDELVKLFPSLRAIGARTLLITGRPDSSAGRLSDLVLSTHVWEEACPNNLAPTTSTTAMLALSDALAVAAMERRAFGREEFARFHPSGSLGKRLLLRVSDVMRTESDLALASAGDPVLDVMRRITQAGAGAAIVVDAQGGLQGVISDGDLRRHFLNAAQPLEGRAEDLMTRDPKRIEAGLLAAEALEVFQNLPVKIGEMPVVEEGKVVGLLALKDLLRSGIV
ncbi:MAG: KpsF/GutQ family sugar-phosphate isomerase [Fimbriimonadaceae bacterium]|nr:KpsF/GutQ family sugar-phosphate isomerase [Chthonomonadaceae bacterium]MCO5296486.1 KpsF/GutQ family sugar-phosphate isomerase [Fimbriimonadaceae bacterium]